MSRVFQALGEPMRLRLLDALVSGERSVSELVTATGASQPNVSKPLSVLTNAGLLRRRKDGLKACYSVVGETPFRLLTLMRMTAKRARNRIVRAVP
ncbi:MAG: metalloregulator ArsR/SmtB family transcription factor [Verrucomicrobiales bacterium]|nr:metalloregulator ArsR/SmtB family transcription factor [Verrucomicrobiales bacterium]